jgi:hypothetical protein
MTAIKNALGYLFGKVLYLVAGAFLLLFAVLWLVLCVVVWGHSGSTPVVFPDAVVTTAGFIGTTVATSTAAVLGITIQAATVTANDTTNDKSFSTATTEELAKARMTSVGALVYLVVGVAVLATWLAKANVAPDLFKAFGLTVLGWAAGGFAAIFKSQ